MDNKVSKGETVDLIAPSGGVTVNVPVQIGQLIVIPETTATVGETFAGFVGRAVLTGLTKIGSQAWTQGLPIYWDAELSQLTSVAGDNHKFGWAIDAVGSGAGETASGEVLFDGTLAFADETT